MAGKRAPAETQDRYRDRFVETIRVRAGDILPHPRNPKRHPQAQLDPLEGSLVQLGKVDKLRAYRSERNGGQLTYFDGHGREVIHPDETWRVDVYDLTDAEADLALAIMDPIAALAERDGAAMEALLADCSAEDERLQEILAGLAAAESPLTFGDDELNDRSANRIRRNEGTQDVVGVGRFIGAAPKDLTEDLSERLIARGEVNATAEWCCAVLSEALGV